MRRISLVGVFMLVMLALATHVTTARADTTNTVTQTAITSPSDPSYFYDPTGGAYGGITVTGTTDSTDPSSDTVDIDCFVGDDGDTASAGFPVATGVALNADGSFSTTVPYSAIEPWNNATDQENDMCRLRAVPAGSSDTTGLSSFAGPRILLAFLSLDYNDSQLNDFQLVAPQLGATNSYNSIGDCGLYSALLNDQSAFGQTDTQTFNCADTSGVSWSDSSPELQVDGVQAAAAYNTDEVTVSASQDSNNGDMTITEIDPITAGCDVSCYDSGVEQDRTIRQSADGHVVEITDSFRSTDGAAHTVDVDVANQQCFTSNFCNWGNYYPTQVLYEFPGETSFAAHADGDTVGVDSTAPASIYVQDAGGDVNGAITYFTAPSGPFRFAEPAACCSATGDAGNFMFAPYELDVPAAGSASMSLAYSSETSQDALAGDIQVARDLQALPVVSITSPAPGSTTSSSTVNVTGTVTATTGVSSVTVNGVSATLSGSSFTASVPLQSGANTITAVVTTNTGVTASGSESVTYTPTTTTTTPTTSTTPITPASGGKWAGPVWLPIADTGAAKRAGNRKEKLGGRVTAGSGSVTYYFEYGTHANLTHRTPSVELAASENSHPVAVTIGGLKRGTKYTYRLVASGSYGHSAGRGRSFKTTAHKK